MLSSKEPSNDPMASFWSQRYDQYGHTGWADGVVYCFDQRYRLGVFSEWLHSTFHAPGSALDFGCGVGDFSNLLLRRGWQVTGYDKYVTPNMITGKFNFIRSIDEIPNGMFDLVVSITVLDCIKNEKEFDDSLAVLKRSLKPTGQFFFLECSPRNPREGNFHQAFRSLAVWKEHLISAGFEALEIKPFFHPTEGPVAGWLSYNKLLTTKVARKLLRFRDYRHFGSRLLGWNARRLLNRNGYYLPLSSPVHIFIGTNATHSE